VERADSMSLMHFCPKDMFHLVTPHVVGAPEKLPNARAGLKCRKMGCSVAMSGHVQMDQAASLGYLSNYLEVHPPIPHAMKMRTSNAIGD